MSDRILSVRELNAEVRTLLEQSYVSVRGELAEVRTAPAWALAYFVLKDEYAELPCVMPRRMFATMSAREGQLVISRGRLTLFEKRGRFQLKVDSLQPAGQGALAARIEALKKKLEAEGLFAPERKRALPVYPQHVAVVSSADGAALKDFIKIVNQRFPAVTITIADVLVQGQHAAGQIAAALRDLGNLHRRRPLDVVVVTRGGGSLEDLMAFNAESVARAIAACPIPVVSAVGHERDVTIADLVADVRASTPSNAAELVVPDGREVLAHVLHLADRGNNALLQKMSQGTQRLASTIGRPLFADPTMFLRERTQRVSDSLAALEIVRERFRAAPLRVTQLVARLRAAVPRLLTPHRQRLAQLRAQARALSPQAVLSRGFSLTTRPDGSVVRSAASVAPTDPLHVRLKKGTLSVTVDRTHDD